MKYLVLIIVLFVSLESSSQNINSATKFDKQEKIIVYGSDTCHYCIDTKTYLKERKIEFIYYDVDVNIEKQREMIIKLQKAGISLDNLSLPVVDLGGKLIMNTPTDFEEFLKKLITKNSKDGNN
ncbi:glutaredoxin family protein [Thalassobellus sediminis]|uniref:glutaredoxin family protein n=1 Tax=Thalassobellus sediminis TaxID=3367753 RepID=UPI0037917D3A